LASLKLAAERLALPRRKITEGHSESAANFRFKLVHPANEPVGREPFRERVSLDERPTNLFRFRRQHPMETKGVRHLISLKFCFAHSAYSEFTHAQCRSCG
jgi:hypothetical protein